MRCVTRICSLLLLPFLLSLCRSGPSPEQPTSQNTEHPKTGNPIVATDLEPRLYWFYDGMKRLRDVHTEGNEVHGVFIDSQKVKKSQDRTAGYKMAVERIIYYLALETFADTENTRQQLRELEKSLQTMTRLNLHGYEAWRMRFDAHEKNLEWSDEKQLMIEEASLKPALMQSLPKSRDIFTIAINPIPSLPASTPPYFTADSLLQALPDFRPGKPEIKVGARRLWESGVIVLNDKVVLFWTTCRKNFIYVLTASGHVSFIIGDGKDDL